MVSKKCFSFWFPMVPALTATFRCGKTRAPGPTFRVRTTCAVPPTAPPAEGDEPPGPAPPVGAPLAGGRRPAAVRATAAMRRFYGIVMIFYGIVIRFLWDFQWDFHDLLHGIVMGLGF